MKHPKKIVYRHSGGKVRLQRHRQIAVISGKSIPAGQTVTSVPSFALPPSGRAFPHRNETYQEYSLAQAPIIYDSEMEYILRCIAASPDRETGGQLFGRMENGKPVVMYALGPGPGAQRDVAFFRQDLRYLQGIGNFLRHQYGLIHIGEWHSHHRLGLDHPSSYDERTISGNMAGRDSFLLAIGVLDGDAPRLNAFRFTHGNPYRQVSWQTMDGISPLRPEIDRICAPVLCHPSDYHPYYI